MNKKENDNTNQPKHIQTAMPAGIFDSQMALQGSFTLSFLFFFFSSACIKFFEHLPCLSKYHALSIGLKIVDIKPLRAITVALNLFLSVHPKTSFIPPRSVSKKNILSHIQSLHGLPSSKKPFVLLLGDLGDDNVLVIKSRLRVRGGYPGCVRRQRWQIKRQIALKEDKQGKPPEE